MKNEPQRWFTKLKIFILTQSKREKREREIVFLAYGEKVSETKNELSGNEKILWEIYRMNLPLPIDLTIL